MDIDSTRNMYLSSFGPKSNAPRPGGRRRAEKKGSRAAPTKNYLPAAMPLHLLLHVPGQWGGGQIVQGGPGKSKVTLAVVFAWAGLGLELRAWAAAVCECVSE